MKVVIVGGVAGGATAAARLRRLDEQAEIVVLERSGYVSYANCGLPYYIGGVITDKQALTLQTPESFWARFRIDVRVHSQVTAIHRDKKTVTVQRLTDGSSYEETYDKLILSPGATAVRPDMPGVEDQRIFTLRTVEDTFRIRDYVESAQVKHAVVIGGGFIGLEAAENLVHIGVQTTMLQLDDHVMLQLDADMASELHTYLRSQGVDLRLGTTATAFSDAGEGLSVALTDGSVLKTDMVLLAIGVRPDSQLAKDAGLALGMKDSILVNGRMETSDPDIYAVGDAVEVRHFVTGQPALIALAGPANKQGRIAADNICGRDSVYTGSQGSSVLQIFGKTVACTGINETQAQAAGVAYDKVVTFSASHATYYPGAENMTVKVLFDPESGRILGAQIVGGQGVDKRIDVLATAIRGGMTGGDLTQLDLAYAPPYSSAKDPVNMAGFVIENVMDGTVHQFYWDQVAALPRDGSVTLLDTRTEAEYAQGHIPGAINIPLDDLRQRLGELERGKPIYVNCYSGLRSYIACRILTGSGFTCYNLAGGYRFYALNTTDISYDPDPRHPCGQKI